MKPITENIIEESAIETLQLLGWTYANGRDLSPEGSFCERESFGQIILTDRLQKAVAKLNPHIPESAREQAVQKVLRIYSPDLLHNNETFHQYLVEKIKIPYQQDGYERSHEVSIVDFENPLNNEFLVVNQFTIIENNHNKRPDILLFVNGIPLIVAELKNPSDENATINKAYDQLETYKATIPGLFTYNSVCVISDGIECRAGSLTAGFTRFMTWKTEDGRKEASRFKPQLDTLIKGMLNPITLLDLIRNFIVFEKTQKEDPQTGLIQVTTEKKLAAYHQYYAVNKAVESTIRATGLYPSNITPSTPALLPKGEGGNTAEEKLNRSKPSPLGRGQGEGAEKQGESTDGRGQGEGAEMHGEGDEENDQVQEGGINYRGGRNYSTLVEFARKLRKNQTPAEEIFWQVVRNRQFLNLKFRRQHQIESYIADFYCNELSLIIELDGEIHLNKEQAIKDNDRDEYLTSLGFITYRFTNDEIFNDIEKVLIKIEVLRNEILPGNNSNETNEDIVSDLPFRNYEYENGKTGSKKGGVVWHTQGSGKSLSMVFYTGKLIMSLNNPTVVVITDRNDLDDQLFETFASAKQLLRQEPVQAESREHLKTLLKVASGGIVFTTIQKFSPEGLGSEYDQLSDRSNIVVIADEAHRTQYGFEAVMKDIIDKDSKEVIGKRIAYGFAKYIRDALPNATYIGFTGTPIEGTDINTPQVFGNYIDIYDISQSVADGSTVRIFYESRLAKVNMDEEGKQLIKEFDDTLTQPLPEGEENNIYSDSRREAKVKWSKLEAIIGSPKRITNLAKDIIFHFEERQKAIYGKGMIVAMSRRIAVDLYNEIVKLKPEWHSDELNKGAIKVIMTASSSDGPVMSAKHTNKSQRKALSDRMKDPDDPLKLVIVRDMWLTGFDVPCLHTMYIDKPMRGHTLMQAIARVNRVFKDKPGGLVVDYLGIGTDLKKALSFYSDSGGKGDPAETQEKAVEMMLEKMEVVRQFFIEESNTKEAITVEEPKAYYLESPERGFNYMRFFEVQPSEKLSIILQAEEHLMGLDDGKNRFINEVSLLGQAFALAIPHEDAMKIKDEVAVFQAIKARLVKFTVGGNGGFGGNGESKDYSSIIKQIVDQALSSDEVVDIFDAAGIKKPEISILSDEFLLEVKNMKHKNLAIELLRKILDNELTLRSKTNLVKSKTLLEMLESSIKRYQNNLLTTAEIIQELINIANEIKKADKEGEELGLSTEEVAFYNALEVNESAVKVLGDDVLKEIAIEIAEKVRQNATIDWTIRESARARLMVVVKRTLKKYGYPPDMQQKAVDTVLKQAEMIADYYVKS